VRQRLLGSRVRDIELGLRGGRLGAERSGLQVDFENLKDLFVK
jgi:hypothetical protein